jgi:hypothetical protein
VRVAELNPGCSSVAHRHQAVRLPPSSEAEGARSLFADRKSNFGGGRLIVVLA